MGSPDVAGIGRRPFQPVSVGTCYAQTANDRFGVGASEAVRERERFSTNPLSGEYGSGLEWEAAGSDDGAETSIYQLVPTLQRYRNNLTALSDAFNLYMVAYQGQIFVYVPRSVPRQTIPRHPDLRLVPGPTEASLDIGGYQDPLNPHAINHIVVGALGTREIVVACYDDGDVVAYLTSDIVHWIARKPHADAGDVPPVQSGICHGPGNGGIAMPRPFLHENVGDSAWGLAVHTQSRLIAVSSNRCEVTVFALGLVPGDKGTRQADTCDCCRPNCQHVESHVRQRSRNWRIIINLGCQADNLPNVCFIDDDCGSADMICAIDIGGEIWLADIWKPSQAAIRIDACDCAQLRNSDDWPGAPSRGWGILALPRSSFLKVESVEELLGSWARDVVVLTNSTLNMESHLEDIPDNPCLQAHGATSSSDLPNQAGLGVGAGQMLDVVEDSDAEESEHSDSDGLVGADGQDDGMVFGPFQIEMLPGSMTVVEEEISNMAAFLPDTVVYGQDAPLTAMQELLAQSLPTQVVAAASGGILAPMTTASVQTAGMIVATALSTQATPMVAGAPARSGDPTAAQRWRGQGHGDGTESAPARLGMIYVPHEGLVFPMPQETAGLLKLLKAERKSNDNEAGEVSALDRLAKRYHLLRLHEKEMELRSLDRGGSDRPREFGILCPRALKMERGAMNATTRKLFRATSRLSMVLHVPELSLVVVGSPIGRVLVLTPTRLETAVKKGPGQLQHGFRVDWILPRRSDEETHRRTVRPLHGVAVGPVQEWGRHGDGRGSGSEKGTDRGSYGGGSGPGPRRYRLMLHYRNHDILTYELTRDGETGKVCIF